MKIPLKSILRPLAARGWALILLGASTSSATDELCTTLAHCLASPASSSNILAAADQIQPDSIHEASRAAPSKAFCDKLVSLCCFPPEDKKTLEEWGFDAEECLSP